VKTLSVTYASAPSADLLIPTLEFKNEAAGVIRLAQSFNDLTATTELAETVTFIQSAWEVSLPNKDAKMGVCRGFIAQELELIDPHYVYECEKQPSQDFAIKCVNRDALIADLIDSIQQLQSRIATLEAKQ